MWQVASPSSKKGKKKKRPAQYHFKRAVVQLKLGTEITNREKIVAHARVFLNEFREQYICMFASHRFFAGDSISITFQEPKRFFCKALVVSCQEVPREAHIISQHNYQYRLVMQLAYASDTDRSEVQEFLQLLNEEYLLTPHAKKRAEAEKQAKLNAINRPEPVVAATEASETEQESAEADALEGEDFKEFLAA